MPNRGVQDAAAAKAEAVAAGRLAMITVAVTTTQAVTITAVVMTTMAVAIMLVAMITTMDQVTQVAAKAQNIAAGVKTRIRADAVAILLKTGCSRCHCRISLFRK
jgi:hypothetical protein